MTGARANAKGVIPELAHVAAKALFALPEDQANRLRFEGKLNLFTLENPILWVATGPEPRKSLAVSADRFGIEPNIKHQNTEGRMETPPQTAW